MFSLSPSGGTYITNENPEPFQNRSCPVPQAASLCTGSPSEARVRGIRQTKPAAMDKTSLSIPHETTRRARNTNPGGLAVSCSLFFCPSVMRQCGWVLNHLLLGGRTPSLKLCVRASQHRLDRDAAAPWLCSWWQRLCSACQCGSQRSSSVAGAPNGESSWPTLPAPRLFPGPGGPPPSFTPDILSHSGYPAVPAVGPLIHAKGPHPGLSLNSIFTSIAKK